MKTYKLTNNDDNVEYYDLTDEQAEIVKNAIGGDASCQQTIILDGYTLETKDYKTIVEIPPDVNELACIISGICREIFCYFDYDYIDGCPEEIIANKLINEYGYQKLN